MHTQGPQPNQVPQHLQGGLYEGEPPQVPDGLRQLGGGPEHFTAALEQDTPTEVMKIVDPNADTVRISAEDMVRMSAVARGIGGIAAQKAAKGPRPGVTYTKQEQRDFRYADQQQARQPQPHDTSVRQWGQHQGDTRPKAQEPRPDDDWTMEDYRPFDRS